MTTRPARGLVALGTALLIPACANEHTVSLAPQAFSLTLPASGAANVSCTPTYAWTPSAGALTYTLQVATDAAFTVLLVDQPGLLVTTSTPAVVLAASTLHHWRVRAVNAVGVHTGTLTVTDPEASNTPQTVDVTIPVVP